MPEKTAMDARHWHGFTTAIGEVLRPEQCISDLPRRLAYSTDASFYTLIPQLVLQLDNLAEVRQVLRLATQWSIPLTFRAAGTSLSGQAISDSVLLTLSTKWQQAEVLEQGARIRMQPGLIGAKANAALAPLGYKIGPDPASINTCKIGGIAANNASGMCCGIVHNSYHTLADMTLVLADGSMLNTHDEQSVSQFRQTHKALLDGLASLRDRVRADAILSQRIRHQYRLKNTMGYGLNALLDYTDPLAILTHLMIGSEGTLGFIGELTLHTVKVAPLRATGLFLFENASAACACIASLKQLGAAAVELMDARALRRVADMLNTYSTAPVADTAVALLIDVTDSNAPALATRLANIMAALEQSARVQVMCPFTQVSEEIERLWQIRKGLFPAVGAIRESGSTVIIEDIAFGLADLAAGLGALDTLFTRHGYDEAIVFGHALDGNVHFVFTQKFETAEDIARYQAFMQEVSTLVVEQFAGTLKAEHGTGRNMAPFLTQQWGSAAVQVMQQIKHLIDPAGILNPGVIINPNKHAHLQHLKQLPAVDPIVDKCIECGFCEPQCPSRNLTLTPRQRIALMRRASLLPVAARAEVEKAFGYLADTTCAATGMCATSCPVGIDTGAWIKQRRALHTPDAASFMANHLALTHRASRSALSTVSWLAKTIPVSMLETASQRAHEISRALPVYHRYVPAGATTVMPTSAGYKDKVVYVPGCPNRLFAAPPGYDPLPDVVVRLLNKAGIEVIIPAKYSRYCCGQPWRSKGNIAAASHHEAAMSSLLASYTEQGRWPVITDASPCALNLDTQQGLNIVELAEFLLTTVVPRLEISPHPEPLMLHVSCSSQQLDGGKSLRTLAKRLSVEVTEAQDISCCGFAGDKGFTCPQLNESALASLAGQIPPRTQWGFSNSRTCEIGLTKAAGIHYQHIAYLLDKVSESLPSNFSGAVYAP